VAGGRVSPPPERPHLAGGVVPDIHGRMHGAFNEMNGRYALPVLTNDLGPLFFSPLAGYALVLETTGRTTGLRRQAPLNYAFVDGTVHVMAGFGTLTHWYRNLQADPRCTVRLPFRTYVATAAEVTDPALRLRAGHAVLRGAGLATLMAGALPWTADDAAVERVLRGVPIVRLEPVPGVEVRPTPADPGGWLWIPVHVAWLAAGAVCMGLLRRVVRLVASGATRRG
jgi:deazaflavin-dependent oxidoreductase (nitroreductase family)